MGNKKKKNDLMASCNQDDDVCYYQLKCDGRDVVCITSPQCLETDDSGSESDSSVDCTVNDIDTLKNCCNGEQRCNVRVNESNQRFCRGNAKRLKLTYRCVKKVKDCPSTSIYVRPTTPTTTPGRETTPQQPVQTSTTSPATSKLTTIRITTQTVPTSPPSSASTSTVQTYTSSLSTTLRVHTSTTGSTPKVRGGNKDELSMLDTSSIIGIAIGSLAFLVLIILIAIILHRKRKAIKFIKNTAPNVGNNPHYFTVEEFPNNQYEEINDVGIPTPNDDYNILGEDNSVKTNHFDNYNHISSAVVNGQVGLGSDGYNHVVLANGSPPKILDNDYNHIKFETGDYNQLKGHNSFKNPKADSYHHILRPSDNEGKM